MAYQYKISWEEIPDDMVEEETYSCDHTMCNRRECKDCYPEQERINTGDVFLCLETLSHGDKLFYEKGKTYQSDQDGCITDELLNKGHRWDLGIYPHWYAKFKKVQKPDRDYFQSVQEEYGVPVTGTPITDKRTFETGAVRDSNKGKPLIHTLLGYTRQRFGYHMAKNADKYGPFNFLKGIPTEAALESLDRHLAAYMAGDRSEDHLSAIIFGVQCCMLNEEKDGIEANEYFNG